MKTTLFVAVATLLATGVSLAALNFTGFAIAQDMSGEPEAKESKLVTRKHVYKDGDVECVGYVAYDGSMKGPLPVVLVVHDWMGRAEYDEERSRMLAELGYFAFSIDVYGKDVRPTNQKEAAAAAGKWRGDIPGMHQRLKAGMSAALSFEQADSERVAIMGYCFGGGCALELARSGADIDGAVSFHGSLGNDEPERAKNVQAKLLVLHGADDPHANMDSVNAFIKEMRDAGVNYEVDLYSDAVHSFTEPQAGDDPSNGVAYNEQADKRSWERMKDFFAEVFAE